MIFTKVDDQSNISLKTLRVFSKKGKSEKRRKKKEKFYSVNLSPKINQIRKMMMKIVGTPVKFSG